MVPSDRPSTRERRCHPRFLPSRCVVLLGPIALGPNWRGERVRAISDVSQGGLCIAMAVPPEPGAVRRARFIFRPEGRVFDVTVLARHLQQSPKFPGRTVVGFQFMNPSVDFLGHLLRDYRENRLVGQVIG